MNVGVVGIGIIGLKHANSIFKGEVSNCQLTSVCVRSQKSAEAAKSEFDESVKIFLDYDKFLDQPDLNGIIIATPHYSHPKMGIKAFNKNIAVLMEKPTGVLSSDVEDLNKVAVSKNSIFSAMFNMRAMPIYIKIKEIIENGQLGKLTKVHWEISDSYRSQAYYDAGSWRATWSGEGGGVLINQGVHYLDLFQWFFGLPKMVHGFCKFGKYRSIEVEDDVTSFMEYDNGLVATLNLTTGEPGGTNRLEIIGSKARLLIEKSEISLMTYGSPEEEFNKTNKKIFAHQEITTEVIETEKGEKSHALMMENWANAFLNNETLIVDGKDGINSLMISNAIYLSTWLNKGISFPIDSDEFKQQLHSKISESETQMTE